MSLPWIVMVRMIGFVFKVRVLQDKMYYRF